MAKGVLTTYWIGSTPYSSYILGEDLTHIEYIRKIRRLNEEIVSSVQEIEKIPDYAYLSAADFIKKLPEILHTACYLAFIAVKAQSMTIEEVLGDEGSLHELTHLLSNSIDPSVEEIKRIRRLFIKLQEMAIGLY